MDIEMQKVDVLAVMDDAATWCKSKSAVASDLNLRAARTIVAELIEADREYDKARSEWWDIERYDQDNYGVYGSEFSICRDCENESGAGILNKGISHESGCRVAALERAEKRRSAALASITT